MIFSFLKLFQGASVLRKQGTEKNPNIHTVNNEKFELKQADSKSVNQTKIRPWIKIGGDPIKNTKNRFSPGKERLNQLQLIASGGLSSSFYDQLLYYTRQKNGFNLFGEKEKSRTRLDLHLTGDTTPFKEETVDHAGGMNLQKKKKEMSKNESLPLHSLTKLHCDPTRNCANSGGSMNNLYFTNLSLLDCNSKMCFALLYVASLVIRDISIFDCDQI